MIKNITTKTQYAVAAMLELAKCNESVSISMIAEKQGINHDYMSIILSELKRKNLITSSRGPKGGYKITRPIDSISISEIMNAVGEKIKVTRCDDDKDGCTGNKEKCSAHKMWKVLENNIESYLSSITLKDILTSDDPIESIARFTDFSIRTL